MKKEWFFDRFCGEQIVIYAEDGKIVEAGVENEKRGDVLGNIYKGKIANIVVLNADLSLHSVIFHGTITS